MCSSREEKLYIIKNERRTLVIGLTKVFLNTCDYMPIKPQATNGDDDDADLIRSTNRHVT